MDYKLRTKPVTTARKIPEEQQLRDTFQTPNYATDLLIPFIPEQIDNYSTSIWECAAGSGMISNRLKKFDFHVFSTDIKENKNIDAVYNFLLDEDIREERYMAGTIIITNPPFSIKDLFIEKAFEYNMPFAFLINADYSGKTIDWIKRGCEKIVPTSRIAFLTPHILRRVHEGEVWKIIEDKRGFKKLVDYKKNHMNVWISDLWVHNDLHNYKTLEECPQELLYKYSSAQFHSMWLTYGFNIGKTETFVDLTVHERKTNII